MKRYILRLLKEEISRLKVFLFNAENGYNEYFKAVPKKEQQKIIKKIETKLRQAEKYREKILNEVKQ